MSGRFVWKHRNHLAACAANVPLVSGAQGRAHAAVEQVGGECDCCAQPRRLPLSPSALNCGRLCAQLEEMVRLHAESAQSAEAAAPAAAGGHYQKPKMQQAYGKAIESIAKYPLPITSAEEAEELQGSQTHKGSHSGGWIFASAAHSQS